MFRLRRTIGWLFLVVVAIFLVSLLGANLYVQSQATQERIQQELSQRLKMPLQIQRISVNLGNEVAVARARLGTLQDSMHAATGDLSSNSAASVRPSLPIASPLAHSAHSDGEMAASRSHFTQ